MRKRIPLEERFWSKVNRATGQGPWGNCWIWKGATNYKYGWLRRDGYAHRVAWLLTRGPIMGGLEVRHLCHIKPCVNPSHLRLGTHADNMADEIGKNRHYRLSDDDVRAIRSRAAAGELGRDLSKEFKVNQGHISRIINRKAKRGVR